jgi:putative membrane protein
MELSQLPALNAALNTTSALLLILGYTLIKQRAITAHTIAMLGATLTSTLFLISYLYYHYHHGATRFQGQGIIRPIYFTILITHTILAAVQVPLIIMTLFHAFRGTFHKHIRIARITLPIWLYVSITGVVIYWMLYRVTY